MQEQMWLAMADEDVSACPCTPLSARAAEPPDETAAEMEELEREVAALTTGLRLCCAPRCRVNSCESF
jgi:hypothetical protein